ncbi:MAG: hypothetical protein Fues2KO_53150 [Fuerstiella sp.]
MLKKTPDPFSNGMKSKPMAGGEKMWRRESAVDGIAVRGSRQFRRAITQTLQLLQQSRQYQSLICSNVTSIRRGYFLYPQSPVYLLASWQRPTVVFRHWSEHTPIGSLALTIAHEARWCQIYRDCLRRGGKACWLYERAYCRLGHMRQCLATQDEIGEELGLTEQVRNARLQAGMLGEDTPRLLARHHLSALTRLSTKHDLASMKPWQKSLLESACDTRHEG